jgi:hypothetical protein
VVVLVLVGDTVVDEGIGTGIVEVKSEIYIITMYPSQRPLCEVLKAFAVTEKSLERVEPTITRLDPISCRSDWKSKPISSSLPPI